MRELLGVVEPGGVVLDPFAGSGTTLVAARALGLKVVGFEMDEGYCDVTAGRLRRRYGGGWAGRPMGYCSRVRS